MKGWSLDLRERAVAHYESQPGATYVSTAKVFGIGAATINRWLRLKRETGEVKELPPRSGKRFKVDLDWLRAEAQAYPDARLIDRALAWQKKTGQRVSFQGVWKALRAIGFTHKKRRSGPRSGRNRTSRSSERNTSKSNPR